MVNSYIRTFTVDQAGLIIDSATGTYTGAPAGTYVISNTVGLKMLVQQTYKRLSSYFVSVKGK
jgi:hypothetical protein